MLPSTKSSLRHYIRSLKATHSAAELEALSSELSSRLILLPQWQASSDVLLYAALPDEVQTGAMIQSAWNSGKRVYLPVVNGDDLDVKLFTPETALHKGAFQIDEPQGEPIIDLSVIDLAIIPGMAFTQSGERLGRGKGYYDRLLPRLTKAFKVGICYPFQLLDSIPSEPHDIRMDLVL